MKVSKTIKKYLAFMLAFLMIFTSLFLVDWGNAANVQASTFYTGDLNYTYAQQVAAMVNNERAKNYLPSYTLDEELMEAAMIRAAEVAYTYTTTGGISHTRPDGTDCFSIYDDNNIRWSAVGENIAALQSSPNDVMYGPVSWMNSTGHRGNILDTEMGFNAIGVGCFYYSGHYFWVQLFARKTTVPYSTKSNAKKEIYVSTDRSNNSYIANSVFPEAKHPASEADIGVTYRTHVQSYGWQQGFVSNGDISGTVGREKRMEAIEIKLQNAEAKDIGIRYMTHIQSYGWSKGWSYNGATSGTSGEAKRLEAIRIELTGKDADKYDIYYRVHAQSYGWLGWAKNGEEAGTAGQAKRLEAIQIKILPKGETAPGVTAYSYIDYGKSPSVNAESGYIQYTTHVQSYGWQPSVRDGSVSGTFGEKKRLEAIRINLNTNALGVSGGVEYRTHVQSLGWEPNWKADGTVSGTSGQAKRLEAIQIRLTGEAAREYDIYYRVHAQSYGWMGWAKNGASAGTSGQAKRLEAIQIVVVPKNQDASLFTSSGSAFIGR